MHKLGVRTWVSFLLIGLAGQFAWTIENMYFNVYLYNTISTDPNHIAAMVAASAAVATLTTLLMGALSDRVGKRKPFLCAGYLLWGVSTMAFGFITVENAARWFPTANAVATAALLVVVLDCVMTFFGSTANDAAFNAYVTDVTSKENRGRVESVLAVLPLLSMLVIFGAFDGMTQQGRWREFFLIFGALVSVVGLVSVFLLRESGGGAARGHYLSTLAYGFRPAVVRENGPLYLALSALGIRLLFTLPCFLWAGSCAWQSALSLLPGHRGKRCAPPASISVYFYRFVVCVVILVIGICFERYLTPYLFHFALQGISAQLPS